MSHLKFSFFVLLKLTYLVTLFDPQSFSKYKRSSLRSQLYKMRLFMSFSNTVSHEYRELNDALWP